MNNNFKIFDAHMHYLGRFKHREESLIHYMDRYGIDKACITTLNQNASLNTILQSDKNINQGQFIEKFQQRGQYDHLQVRELVKAHPDRLYGFFWFNPKIGTDEDWSLLRKYIRDYGFRGVKTQCYVDMLKVPADLYALAEFCIDLYIPLYVHSGSAFFFQKPVRCKDYYTLAKKYKDLKLIIGHAAFTMEYCINCLRFFAKNPHTPNVYFETSVSIPYGIMTLIKAIGSDRVLFGSDAPAANPPDIEINKVTCLGLEKETLEQVFYYNMDNLINKK